MPGTGPPGENALGGAEIEQHNATAAGIVEKVAKIWIGLGQAKLKPDRHSRAPDARSGSVAPAVPGGQRFVIRVYA